MLNSGGFRCSDGSGYALFAFDGSLEEGISVGNMLVVSRGPGRTKFECVGPRHLGWLVMRGVGLKSRGGQQRARLPLMVAAEKRALGDFETGKVWCHRQNLTKE